jgi:hypothetical protein
MKKQSRPKSLQLNRETLSNLELQRTSGGLLSWIYDCDWKGVSKAFSNCEYCTQSGIHCI